MKFIYNTIIIILSIIMQSPLFPALDDNYTNNTVTLYESLKDDISINQNQEPTIIKNVIKEILILCPPAVSGGPEALCQLCYELSNAGFKTNMLWISDFSQIQKQYKNNAWYLCGQDYNWAPFTYQKKYNPSYLKDDLILDKSTLVIVPEVWGDFIPFFKDAKIAFYWLSTTYFSSKYSNKYRTLIMQNKFDPLHCFHFSDAPWISTEITKLGINSELLEAPIASTYLNNSSKNIKTTNIIAYNPAKGADLSKSFMDTYPQYDYFPLKNLDEQGIINALDSAKIYIDFGDFPGKDRIPREALMRNCIIFIHNINCATDFESFPIDDFFKFSIEDVLNGVLNDKILQALNNYEKIHEKQNYARTLISEGPQKFITQIKTLFGTPKNN